MRATTRYLSKTSDGPSPSRLPFFLTETSRKRLPVDDDGGNSSQKNLPVELSNNEPEDIVQESVTTSHESADIEEPNVPSTENEEPTELVNAEVIIILERSTTESRDIPAVAASLIDHTLSTTNKSTPFSSTMPLPPP
ncbi:hypothetical protein K3495_g10763 [Podosphaera aphanis]|nr:hypothetical protein K3495_g10763 [Podosphaera aphanis]